MDTLYFYAEKFTQIRKKLDAVKLLFPSADIEMYAHRVWQDEEGELIFFTALGSKIITLNKSSVICCVDGELVTCYPTVQSFFNRFSIKVTAK